MQHFILALLKIYHLEKCTKQGMYFSHASFCLKFDLVFATQLYPLPFQVVGTVEPISSSPVATLQPVQGVATSLPWVFIHPSTVCCQASFNHLRCLLVSDVRPRCQRHQILSQYGFLVPVIKYLPKPPLILGNLVLILWLNPRLSHRSNQVEYITICMLETADKTSHIAVFCCQRHLFAFM